MRVGRRTHVFSPPGVFGRDLPTLVTVRPTHVSRRTSGLRVRGPVGSKSTPGVFDTTRNRDGPGWIVLPELDTRNGVTNSVT